MIHTSNAIIAATLALSAAAPIQAAPAEPRINSGFSSVNVREPLGPLGASALGGTVGGASFSLINGFLQHFTRDSSAPPPAPVEPQPATGPAIILVPIYGNNSRRDLDADTLHHLLGRDLDHFIRDSSAPPALVEPQPATGPAIILVPIYGNNSRRDLEADTLHHLLSRDLDHFIRDSSAPPAPVEPQPATGPAIILVPIYGNNSRRDLEDLFARSVGIDELD